MRVVFVPLAWTAHYFPMVPLAWAFRAAGHDVRVVSQPPLADAITASGLPGYSVGGDYDFMKDFIEMFRMARAQGGRTPDATTLAAMPPEQLRMIRNLRFAHHVKAADAMADGLVRFVREWRADMIVADPLMLVAPLAAAVADIPFVRNLWGPDVTRQMGFPGYGMPVEDWPDELVTLYERFGVGIQQDYAAHTVDPCPESIQVPGLPNRIASRYVPYNGAGTMPDWLLDPTDRPRVCVTGSAGQMSMMGADGFKIPAIVEALAGFDVEIVIAVRESDRELVGTTPPGTRVVVGLPLHLLLPTCTAAVHHGGTGAIMTSAACGVPQVILTQVGDQMFAASRLSAVGAAIGISSDEADVDDLKTAIASLLSDSTASDAARDLQEQMLAQAAPAEVVRALT
jgi:UDP:flavonoid glycosyltransferase YjiC (YdhE family)